MSNTGTVKVELRIDDKGVVRGFRQVGDESNTAGRKGKKAFDDVDRSAKQTSQTLEKMGTAIVGAFAVGKVVDFAKAMNEAGVYMDGLIRSYESFNDTSAMAHQQMDFVNKTSKDLGLNLRVMERSYKGITASARGTNLEGEKTDRIFTAVAKTAAVLNMSVDDTRGTLRALEQMISKGNVQAEELRGQLGERLPGAFLMAAEAMGVSTQELNKMLEQGQVLAEDLLPRLADVLEDRYGSAAVKAGDSARAAFSNLSTAIEETKRRLAASGLTEFFADVARMSTNVINMLNESMAPEEMEDRLARLKARLLELQTGEKQVSESTFEISAAMETYIRNTRAAVETTGEFNRAGSQIPVGRMAQMAQTTTKTEQEISQLQEEIKSLEFEIMDAQARKAALGVGAVAITARNSAREVKDLSREMKALNNDLYDADWGAWGDGISPTRETYRKEAVALGRHMEDMWLLRDEGAARAEKRAEDMQTRMTQMEYDAAEKSKKNAKDAAQTWTDAFKGWASNMASDLNDILWKSDSTFANIGRSFAKMVTQMIIQTQAVEPFMSWAGSGITAAGSWLTSFFHSGGVVGIDSSPKTRVPAAMFDKAPRLHTGLMPDEFAAILRKKETVFTEGQTRALGSALSSPQSVNVKVEVINRSGSDVEVSETRSRFDGASHICSVVLDRVHRNRSYKNNMRQALGVA